MRRFRKRSERRRKKKRRRGEVRRLGSLVVSGCAFTSVVVVVVVVASVVVASVNVLVSLSSSSYCGKSCSCFRVRQCTQHVPEYCLLRKSRGWQPKFFNRCRLQNLLKLDTIRNAFGQRILGSIHKRTHCKVRLKNLQFSCIL